MEAAEVGSRDGNQGGVELNAKDVAEGMAGGEKEGAALAAAEIDKGEA